MGDRMYENVYDNYVKYGIEAIKDGECNRCFGKNLKEDSFGVIHCLDCYSYKEITSDKYLFRKMRSIENKVHKLELNFDLTTEQISGSDFLVNCYIKRKNAFLQAVCGAGKTEMTLQLIHYALLEEKTVAFVIPRVEIIKQVSLRMQEYFPKTTISSIYGGSSLLPDSPFIITTPQQLIKFYQEFDLMIIDEVDAFPFVENQFLERLIKKSAKKNAVMIYMSATITKKYQQLIKQEKIEYHLISRRFHKKDLAIPIFVRSDNFLSDKTFKIILDLVSLKKPLIIYVASIAKALELKSQLDQKSLKVDYISSETKYKKAVIKAFVNEELDILVSTTLLERGVTFKNINVIVLEADADIFNEASLIQIAGRVGRIGDEGLVIFISKFKSEAMMSAKKAIATFNKSKL